MSANACTGMVLSQFELSKITLKNLNRFDLSPTAKLVLLALVDCYNPRTEEIFPKQKTIAEQLGISVSSVIRAIKELAHAQIVIYETKSTNRYKLTPTFFTLVKLTAASSQNESLSCSKLPATIHGQKHEEKKNNVFQFQKNNEPKTISIETTRKMLEEKNNIQPKSPMDDRETAIQWLSELTENELKHSFIKLRADEIRKKWNL